MTEQRLLVIIPISEAGARPFIEAFKREIEPIRDPNVHVDYQALGDRATPFIQSRAAELWDGRDIARVALEAERDGYDGLFINCFGEPAVEAVKEIVDIPVVGGFAPAMMNAAMVSSRFSIVTVVSSVVPMLWDLARQWGMANHLASVRQAGIPVEKLDNKIELQQALLAQSLSAIRDDQAEAIVLGCTGMLEVNQWLTDALEDELGRYVPVVAPVGAAIGMLQSLMSNRLRASRITYEPPTEFPQ
ncbi:hydantoin racemase [Vibrio coralliilyticus]|nr:aspartate/glutamate racemase family protein [Vibrio coralliilyticus]NOI30379.1 hydantoin racemase [Vibrio coralliilyticus]NOI49967.1 hydantoin racemase [Vibrio coralliilyticus]